jgi:riboflavin synthase
MFSGIIEHTAKIISKNGGLFRVENTFSESLDIGQSIAHDGACMTLTAITPLYYEFFVMEESLSLTNFGEKGEGEYFNVERALRLGGRLDGHMVTGHIDTVGKVILIQPRPDGSSILSIAYSKDYSTLVIRK